MVAAMTVERVRWLLLGLAVAILAAHSLAYDFITDDAYISFVYSRNFAEHGELVFNLGQYVEGYTNFLWTLLIGLGMMIDIPPELSAKLLAGACSILTLIIVTGLVERALGRRTAWAPIPALLLALSGVALIGVFRSAITAWFTRGTFSVNSTRIEP